MRMSENSVVFFLAENTENKIVSIRVLSLGLCKM